MSKLFNALALLILAFMSLCRPAEAADDLEQTIRDLDQTVFHASFDTCDIDRLAAVTSDSFEFYHDQSGITDGKRAFLDTTRNGLCKLDYKARRELVPGSMRVFPLHENGRLYGAIQIGEHRFYATYEGHEEILTSTALFTHLWLLEDGRWKLSRVLSYDHRPAEDLGRAAKRDRPDQDVSPAREPSSTDRPARERGI